ncbi:unnamed protein product [Larinioides sclopetarius]|uniref:Regulator of microtubule dynamics protein 1 n=1 Tax=Larinioides sclopetarius TaxID=280406 RepID=A0AAV1ZDX2_9ARAC
MVGPDREQTTSFNKIHIMTLRNLSCKIAFWGRRFSIFQLSGQCALKVFKSYNSNSYLISSPFLPAFLLLKAASSLQKSGNSKIIDEADNLYNDGKYQQLYLMLDPYHLSNDPEILWRLARAIFEKCRDVKEDKEKIVHLEKALHLVDKALEIKEECWAAHKCNFPIEEMPRIQLNSWAVPAFCWRAILLDYVWRYKSTKERIIHSFDVKKHMERAVELNPQDSTSYYLIGEWCYTFADMPWYQRKVAAAIFASPPTSTYEEALKYFEKAEETNPLFYSMNLLMMGKCYLKMNDEEKAIKYLKQARDYLVKTPDDQKAHEEAEKLLKDLIN